MPTFWNVDLLFKFWSFTAKIWTVPLSLDAHKNAESGLNLMQYKFAGSEPRRSSVNSTRFWVSNILMSVPLTDAVASNVPWIFIDMQAKSDWWALIVTGAVEGQCQRLQVHKLHSSSLVSRKRHELLRLRIVAHLAQTSRILACLQRTHSRRLIGKCEHVNLFG